MQVVADWNLGGNFEESQTILSMDINESTGWTCNKKAGVVLNVVKKVI